MRAKYNNHEKAIVDCGQDNTSQLFHAISARLLIYSWIRFASMQESEHWERQGHEHQWHQGRWPTEIRMTMTMRYQQITVQSWWGHDCPPHVVQEPMAASKDGEAITWILLPSQSSKKEQRELLVAADHFWGHLSNQLKKEAHHLERAESCK